MPTDYAEMKSMKNYVDTHAKTNATYDNCDALYAIVACDLNCQNNSRFYNTYQHLIPELMLCSQI
jgi:hypothetical protein